MPATLSPYTINILIVADGRIYADRQSVPHPGNKTDLLYLSELIKALNEPQSNYATFNVRFQRRDLTDPYQFDSDPNLNSTDEIWLFGDARPHAKRGCDSQDGRPLQGKELNRVIEFMNIGGIFATGDHEDLGVWLNGNIPRVKSMRKWDSTAPPRNLKDRHDTLSKDAFGNYFEDDKTPQEIQPQMYRLNLQPIYGEQSYPHPLLSHNQGIINLMPDHQHEGECCVPASFPAGEFPSSNGIRPLPLVIAQSIIGSHTTQDFCNPKPLPKTKPGIFGSIGAYDGHKAGIGRVVVDSSFHHFLDLNLDELKNDSAIYELIKSYYQNIRLWLVPKNKQQQIFLGALEEAISSRYIPANLSIDPYSVVSIGDYMRQILAGLASPAMVLQWTIDLLYEMFGANPLMQIVDPWIAQLNPDDDNLLPFDIEALVNAVIGGAVIRYVTQTTEDVESLLVEGALEGAKAFLQYLDDQRQTLEKAIGVFTEILS